MPKIASAFSFGIITVAVLLPLARAQTPQQIESQSTVRQQAEEVWEQAIAAKGARERLYEVRNLVIRLGRAEHRAEWLYVFPNKLWAWTDSRPGPLEISIEVNNADTGQAWTFNSDWPPHMKKPVSHPISERFAFFRIRDQVCYLLETRWVKPVPIKVEKERIGWKKFDVLHAEVEAYGERSYVVFYFDPRTHLPSKVGFKHVEDAKYYYWVYMSDYVEIGGIQMPQKVSYKPGPMIPANFEINVEYDPTIFERPPSIAAGPEAWKVKPRR